MTDYNDGKIYGWNGGECPVHPESEVKVWFRRMGSAEAIRAKQIWWGDRSDGGDVVCFQVTKAHAEPKTIWVNEWGIGSGYSYTTEEDAKENAGPRNIRIAVKYVEKQK